MGKEGSDRAKLLGILTFAFLILPGLGQAGGSHPQPVPLGPPYIIDSYHINSSVTVDGFLNEPVWTAPTTSLTKTTLVTNGLNLTIRTFFNATSLFIGAEVCGDASTNANSYMEICFDTDHDATALPDASDMKLVAKGVIQDTYSLWYGDGAAWVKWSDNTNAPNTWPAGYAADGELSANVTYEFQVPIAAAWGVASPPNGDIAGFTVHAYSQVVSKHTWWPDNQGTGTGGAPVPKDYCNDPSTWGDIVYHGSANVPDHLEYVLGSNQTAQVGTVLAQPLSVRVKNQTEGNVSGAQVNFTMTALPGSAGHGFVGSGNEWLTVYSDTLGYANATVILGSKPGTYWINASGVGFTGNAGPKYINWLHENATIGPLATLETRPDPASVAPLGSSAATVYANDSMGNGITGLVVNMAFDSNPSGASLGSPATDNGDGTYSAAYTAGPTGGVTDVINATSGGKWGNASIQVGALPLGSIQMVSSASSVQVTGAATLTIWANDTGGGGMPGQTITLTFDANPSGAFLTAVSEIGGGVYSATYTAGQTAWVMDTVKASCSGKEDTVNISVQAGVPSDLVYVSGNGQQKNISLVLDAPFVARAVDAYGNTVPGVPMSWTIASFPAGATGQLLTPASNATDANGLSGTVLRLGNLAGWYNATASSASIPGDSVAFSAEGLYQAVPVVQVYSVALIDGDGQTGSISSKLTNPSVVEVRNQTGVLASGVNVWFNVTAGGGHPDNGNVTTGATGRAQTFLTLGPSAGLNTVSAEISSGGTSGVSFYAIGTAPEISVGLASNLTSLVVGGSMVFILTYDNTGTEAAKDVRLNFTMPANLYYISDSSGVTPTTSQNRLTWLFQTSAVGPHSFVMLCRLGSQASASFACYFDVNYSSQSGFQLLPVISNTVTVDVLQEAGNNIPPVIDGVPDLIVHYDWDYMIDLAPYIYDPDDSESELSLILSDNVNARVNSTDNLAIILNYSHDLLGIPQSLNITVSDGFGSDWDVITVTVSDDFPPEIIDNMPDVTFDEDMSCYAFNITHYFFDRDGDSLYYTYGQKHMNITILANYTVLIRGLPDWYGQERITFRALDPTGALIEDTITVTVWPVNDAPVLLALPDQNGVVNIAWVLDLSPYVSDVDNALTDLIIAVDADYATVNGLNITFRCSGPIELDILTVTISDGSAQVYGQININVESAASTTDSFPSWIFVPLIIIIAIISLLLIATARRKPVIEQAFLIYKDGALLAHTTNRMIPEMDTQIFSSMFTAIQDFIKDSFKDEENWSLDKLEFGDNKIFIAKGEEGLYNLTLVYKGKDRGLQSISKRAIEAIDKEYGKTLKGWDGNLDSLRGVRDVLTDSIFK